MGIAELLLIGAGLSMDAFAVSVCKGLKMKKVNKLHCGIIALFFGEFQALMPLLGWVLGKQFESYITSIDHWIAFLLLVLIGANMMKESRQKEEEVVTKSDSQLNLKELFVLAVATSIDALAVGITFAFLKVDILLAVTIIGSITLILSAIGVFVGNIFGIRYKDKAELAGGLILILMGCKILVEHLGILPF